MGAVNTARKRRDLVWYEKYIKTHNRNIDRENNQKWYLRYGKHDRYSAKTKCYPINQWGNINE